MNQPLDPTPQGPTSRQNAPAWFRRALDVPYTVTATRHRRRRRHPLPGLGRTRQTRTRVRPRRCRPRPLVDPRGRPVRRRNYRVVAIDLSGHGDSDRRDEYSLDALDATRSWPWPTTPTWPVLRS